MHPLIRILCLLVLAALAPWLPPAALLAAGMLLLAFGIAYPETGRSMRRGVHRIRWLLLSLLVLYLWFSPGAPLLPALGPLSPTASGLALAAERGGLLLVLVLAATAFLGGIAPRRLAAALRQLLGGSATMKSGARFADRVGLLMAELPAVEQRLRTMRGGEGGFAARAASLFEAIEADAARPLAPEPLPAAEHLPRWQWLLPAGLLVAGLLLAILSR